MAAVRGHLEAALFHEGALRGQAHALLLAGEE